MPRHIRKNFRGTVGQISGLGINTVGSGLKTLPAAPPDGTLDFVHDYTAARGQATAPLYGWEDIQFGNSGNTIVRVTDGITTGVPSARLTIAADSSSDAIEGQKDQNNPIGLHRFYGVMYKFPTNWQTPNTQGWGAGIAQLGYQGFVNHTWGLFAHADHVRCVILSGKQSWPATIGDPNTTPIREYNNSDGAAQGPSPRVITNMALGSWHQLIAEIRWSTCSTASPDYPTIGVSGLTRVWHKLMGESSWTLMMEELDIPTFQWGRGYNFGSGSPTLTVDLNGGTAWESHKWGLYAGPASFDRVIEHGKISIGTTFASVAALMP